MSLWKLRIDKWDRKYNAWANKFKCKVLEEYYEGKQWKFNTYFSSEPYVVNLVYSTIKIKAANLLLSYPKFLITPRPGNADYSQEIAMQSAQLKEDTLNTVIADDKEAFVNAVHLCFLDSQFRFGIMEVGYAADWLRNPLAGIPQLKGTENNIGVDESGDTIIENPKIAKLPDELPENEKIYFKHIPASRFRVGSRDAQELDRCDYVGYYEYVLTSDLKAIKQIKSDSLNSSLTSPTNISNIKDASRGLGEEETGDTTKIWHVWDIRAKERLLILDTNGEILWKDEFKRLPLIDIRWDLLLQGWYPMPPVFQWLSPQNEYNETREMMRSHRKRFVRKFQIVGDDSIEEEEIDKFTNGEDGALIKVPTKDAISPIQNPELSASVEGALIISKDDFNEVSGTSSADRGRADRTTATESQRLGMKADIRDSAEDVVMLSFLKRIGREGLLLMGERFVEGTWAKLSSDPGEDFLGEVNDNPAYQWVTSEKIDDGYDFAINCEIISASPLKNEDEEKKFIKFITYINQFPQISLSPLLVRECAYRCGYRNEKVIKEMQKMALLTMMGSVQNQQQQAAQQQIPGQTVGSQMQPPAQQQIQTQLQKQVQ